MSLPLKGSNETQSAPAFAHFSHFGRLWSHLIFLERQRWHAAMSLGGSAGDDVRDGELTGLFKPEEGAGVGEAEAVFGAETDAAESMACMEGDRPGSGEISSEDGGTLNPTDPYSDI